MLEPLLGVKCLCSYYCCLCSRCSAALCAPTAWHAVPSHQRHPRSHFALLQKLTFLRMGDMMIDNWSAFGAFLQRLTCPPS